MRNKWSEPQQYSSLLPKGFLVWISGKDNQAEPDRQSGEARAESLGDEGDQSSQNYKRQENSAEVELWRSEQVPL